MIAWWRRRAEVPRLDEAEACRIVAAALPGFEPQGALIGQGARTAIVAGSNGRVAVLNAQRRAPVVHEVRWDAVRAGAAGLSIDTPRRHSREVLVAGVDALDVRRIMPMPTR